MRPIKRPGFTLIELITVIAVMAVVLGVSVLMFGQLFDFQRNHNEYSEGVRVTHRLIADFRHDVRSYGKPEIVSEEGTLLRWTTESEMVEYTLQPGAFPEQQNVHRTVRKDGAQIFHETYRLPDDSTLSFAEGAGDDAGLVVLSLWITPPGTKMPKPEELNPFDRTMPQALQQQVDPKYAGNWRTIIVRY